MSKEIAQKALNVFGNNTKDKLNYSLTITGGEPLINFEVTRFIIKTAEDLYEYTKEQVVENHFYVVQDLKQKKAFMKYFNTNKLLHRSVGHK